MDKSELSRELFLNIISTRMAFRQTIQRVLKRNKIAEEFILLQSDEAELYRKYKAFYGYTFFIAKKVDKTCTI